MKRTDTLQEFEKSPARTAHPNRDNVSGEGRWQNLIGGYGVMSGTSASVVLAAVQETSRWPACRLLPAANGDGRGVRGKSAPLWLRPSHQERLSLMSPVALRFVPDKSIGGSQERGRTERGFSEVVIAAVDGRGGDHGALGPAPAIEIEFAGRARLHIAASTPPELAAAVVRALRPMIPVPTGVRCGSPPGTPICGAGSTGRPCRSSGTKARPAGRRSVRIRGGAETGRHNASFRSKSWEPKRFIPLKALVEFGATPDDFRERLS